MIKPKMLRRGDKIAIISLSWGGLGDKNLIHKYNIAKERLENDFGLEVVTMPNALKGTEYIYNHPEKRAKDLMDAFKDKSIKGIFCAIGGDDTIRLLPYIDYEVIKDNPKIFMGYSDTTVNHFMMNKEGNGVITGKLLGGCIDVFPMMVGTEIWPTEEEWKDKILLIETSEDRPNPIYINYYLRNLGALGIFDEIKGIIVGKPQAEQYYDEYKEAYKKVLREFNKETLPVLYNVNIGHSDPIGILPLGTEIEVDFDNKKIHLKESPTIS